MESVCDAARGVEQCGGLLGATERSAVKSWFGYHIFVSRA